MTMTEDDVKRIVGDMMLKQRHADTGELDRLKHLVQWAVRDAFNEAWIEAGGDPVESHHSKPPVGWRAAWMKSRSRAVLVRQGLLSGEDTYK